MPKRCKVQGTVMSEEETGGLRDGETERGDCFYTASSVSSLQAKFNTCFSSKSGNPWNTYRDLQRKETGK